MKVTVDFKAPFRNDWEKGKAKRVYDPKRAKVIVSFIMNVKEATELIPLLQQMVRIQADFKKDYEPKKETKK